jgi:cytochrome c2
VSRACLAVGAVACGAAAGCDRPGPAAAGGKSVPGGDAARGRAIVASGVHGCTACHTIPDMPGPGGVVGPPLEGMARRGFIAGQLPNNANVLVAFLQEPSALVPNTGMPDVRLGLDEARDIAAYLYTLEPPHDP